MSLFFRLLCLPVLPVLFSAPALADVTVEQAWVRGTVGGQSSSAAYFVVRSDAPATLVEAHTPVASSIEIHTMRHEGGVMKMRKLPGLALPAGKEVALRPGGEHLMLLGLKRPLSAGRNLPLTLVIEQRDGQRTHLEVSAEIRTLTGRPAPPSQSPSHVH